MAAQKSNRSMIVILGIGGFLVVVLLFINLTKGDDSSTSTPPVSTTAAGTITPGAGGVTTTTTAPGEPTIPSGEFDVFATRNPFEPVVQIDTGGSSTGTTTGGTTTPEAPADGGTSSGATTAGQAPEAGTSVAVIDVFEQGGTTVARVQVGSTVYTVAAGETFAGSYKLVAVSGTCGQFLFGDSPFSLCEGEQVIK